MRTRALGLIQLTAPDNIIAGSAEACARIMQAAEKGAEIIFTPETTHLLTKGGKATMEAAHFEETDPGLSCFCGLARSLGVWLHIGSLIVKIAADRLANRQF